MNTSPPWLAAKFPQDLSRRVIANTFSRNSHAGDLWKEGARERNSGPPEETPRNMQIQSHQRDRSMLMHLHPCRRKNVMEARKEPLDVLFYRINNARRGPNYVHTSSCGAETFEGLRLGTLLLIAIFAER